MEEQRKGYVCRYGAHSLAKCFQHNFIYVGIPTESCDAMERVRKFNMGKTLKRRATI